MKNTSSNNSKLSTIKILLSSGFLITLGLLASSARAQTSNSFLNKSNLDVSANLAALGGYSNRDHEDERNHLDTGIVIQEVEVLLSANADPHSRAPCKYSGMLSLPRTDKTITQNRGWASSPEASKIGQEFLIWCSKIFNPKK